MGLLAHTRDQGTVETVDCERAPKKAKTVLSAGKVMATVFWDLQGVICIDYLERDERAQGSTMPNYWADLMLNCRKAALFGKEISALLP